MGIEAIGRGIGRGISAVGRGPSLGKMFGAQLEAPLSTIVKEGPVRSLAGFKPIKPELNAAAVVAEANHWLGLDKPKVQIEPVTNSAFTVIPRERSDRGNLPSSWKIASPCTGYWYVASSVEDSLLAMTTAKFIPAIKRAVEPVAVPRPWVVIAPIVKPEEETETGIQAASQSKTEGQVAPKEQEQEEEVEEIVEKKVEQERVEEGSKEEQIIERRRYLQDEQALSQRKSEIRQAVIKAKIEADRLGLKKIAGWLVAKFLPAEHEGNRSEIVKKTGPDGSYQETVEAVAGAGEFESEKRAVATFDQVAEEKKPVRLGKEGKPVENQDIARVFKYRFVKPAQPFKEVVTMVTKKRISQMSQSPMSVAKPVMVDAKQERSLEELNPALAEVFQKTAA